MTEYELATLAFREASLDAQRAGLWIAGAQVAATLAIGLGQIAVVWYGIRAMQRAGEWRAREQDQRHAEAMGDSADRHEETMRVNAERHEETIRVNAERHEETIRVNTERHEETMRVNAEHHEEAMRVNTERHEEAMTALKELIARTGGAH